MFGKPKTVRACKSPSSGRLASSISIRGIADATGNHFQNFHHLFTRIPIRKTTKSPSSLAVMRAGISLVIELDLRPKCTVPFDNQGAVSAKKDVVARLGFQSR